MSLTVAEVKNAKPQNKTQKLFDGGGMYLEVTPKGGKWWRLKYRFAGKENRISLGVYPEVSLKMARERRDEIRKQLTSGIDPSQNKKAIKASRVDDATNTFEVIVREWHAKNIDKWTSAHGQYILKRFEQDLFPSFGDKPIAQIQPQDFLKILNKVQERGAVETAHRLLQYSSKVFRYAMITNRLDRDFSIGLKEALKPVQKFHLAAITDPKQAGELLRAIDGYEGNIITKLALQFAPLVFVRPGELRQAEWAEIDLEKAEWNIPAEKMKMRQPHLVPLSKQALDILQKLQPITGHCGYVFPSLNNRTRPMSDNTLLAALRRLGYSKDEMCVHGFRAMARTILDEVLQIRTDFIEHQLAHAVRDANGRAYNRTSHLPERRKMMQAWAEYLEQIKVGGTVLDFKQRND